MKVNNTLFYIYNLYQKVKKRYCQKLYFQFKSKIESYKIMRRDLNLHKINNKDDYCNNDRIKN